MGNGNHNDLPGCPGSTYSRTRALRCINSIPFQSAVQSTTTQPKGFRRLTDVPIVTRQSLLDEKALDFFQVHILQAGRCIITWSISTQVL